MGVVGIVGCYNGLRIRGTKKVENHCSMQICYFKKTFHVKKLKCLTAESNSGSNG